MRHPRILPLTLSLALSVSLLSSCGGEATSATPPQDSPPAVSETLAPSPSTAPEGSAVPSESPAPSGAQSSPSPTPEQETSPSAAPTATPAAQPTSRPTTAPAPTSTPVPTPSAAPNPAPTPTPASAESVLESVWNDIAQNELPMLTDLNDSTLQAVYGISAADLEAYLCKMPAMNTQATEFFLAKVKPGKLDAVKAAVEQRQADLVQQWSQYLPEQLELVENYQLVTNGDYILFAIGECAQDAVDAFNTYTK